MRIFLSCLQSARKHPIPAYGFWEPYFKRGIEEAGDSWVEAVGIDWVEGLACRTEDELQVWRERTWSRAIDELRKLHQKSPIDYFLSYFFPKQIEPAAIEEIKRMGIPCVNFFCDNVREFTNVPESFHPFDLHWVPEYKSLDMYHRAGCKILYAPMPVWVPPEHRTYEHPENYGTTFIGSRDPLREALFAEAINLNAEFEIRGPGWSNNQNVDRVNNGQRIKLSQADKKLWRKFSNQANLVTANGLTAFFYSLSYKYRPKISDTVFHDRVREAVFGADYIAVTQQSQITLGVNRYPSFRYPFSRPDAYSRLRDIEAPMLGACYLTEWAEGLDDLYEPGKEIEIYRTPAEMVEKIRELKADSEKRRKLRRQGQKRALSHHSVANSISKISVLLGLKNGN